MTLGVLFVSIIIALSQNQGTFAGWRSVSDAKLSIDATNTYAITDDEGKSIADCNTTCSNNLDQCLSFAYSADDGCMTYNTRFGFGGVYLVPSTYTYYEKPTDIDDTLGDQIRTRIVNDSLGYQNFLAWFREGIPGQIYIDETSESDLELLVEMTGISDVEDCAKLCLRRRGVIDDIVGTRCDSFNWASTNEGTCQLLSISLDDAHGIDSIESNTWKYYDRLQGSGCWITQGSCRKDPSNKDLIGTWEESGVSWEFECMALIKDIHENYCDGDGKNATVGFWGGSDGQAVFDSWNSWDFSTGCIIDLGGPCYVNGNESRFHDKFRDSIAEEQFNAFFSSDACLERADIWRDYCGFGNDRTVSIEHPLSGSVYVWPLINCSCDSYGMKIDIATQLPFCTRNITSELGDSECWRPKQEDFWSSGDILCEDIEDGCPTYDVNDWNSEDTHCWLLELTCVGNDEFAEDGHYQIICPDELVINGVCEYTEEHCENVTLEYHEICENDPTDSNEQIVSFYMPSGSLFVYPDFQEPAEETLIRGIDDSSAYTQSDSTSYDMITIGSGRWMAFQSGTTRTIRQITLFFQHTESVSLTLTLFEGEGVTGTLLITTSVGEFGPTSDDGEYIHFSIDSVEIQSDAYYTWQLTSTQGNNDDGYIAWGDDYSFGYGDLTWDYIFVVWTEFDDTSAGQMALIAEAAKSSRPWFEFWFIFGCVLLLIFLIFLCVFHWKRKREEKIEREEDRKRQQEIKKQARQKAMMGQGDEFDEDDGAFMALDDDEDSDIGQTPQKNMIEEEEDEDQKNINPNSGSKKRGDLGGNTDGAQFRQVPSNDFEDLDSNDVGLAFDRSKK